MVNKVLYKGYIIFWNTAFMFDYKKKFCLKSTRRGFVLSKEENFLDTHQQSNKSLEQQPQRSVG